MAASQRTAKDSDFSSGLQQVAPDPLAFCTYSAPAALGEMRSVRTQLAKVSRGGGNHVSYGLKFE